MCQRSDVDWGQYEAAFRDYDQRWRLVDETLYALCKAHPGHTEIGEVTAKLAIVGRTYNAGIERQVLGNDSQAGALGKVAAHRHGHGAQIDSLIGELAGLQEPLSVDCLSHVASVHGRFVQLLMGVTKERTPRSFASKYLHFHAPVVPIYDAAAANVIAKMYPGRGQGGNLNLPAESDSWYAWYLARFWRLYQDTRKGQERCSVKLVDHFLLSAA